MGLVILNDGHGMDTAGKRTPTGIKENEFNRPAIDLFQKKLEVMGHKVYQASVEWNDVPLKLIVERANAIASEYKRLCPNDKVIFISVHYNAAADRFETSTASGVETFHYPGSVEGQKLANAVHQHLIKGTKQKDRGVKTADFYVLKYTTCPSILIECGFMDDEFEASLMRDPKFHEEVAEEVVKGITAYMGVAIPQIPKHIKILKSTTANPLDWIKFVDEMSKHPVGQYLPDLIVKLREG